jgi:hypothetical protein
LVILERWSQFLPVKILQFVLPEDTGMKGMCQDAQVFSFDMGVSWTSFYTSWSGTMILQISAFHIASDDRHMPPCLPLGWNGGFTSLPGLASNHHLLQLSLPCS